MSSTGNHHKHPPLARPELGEWGHNEIALLGAPCSLIKMLAESIAESMHTRRNVCYVDADHAEADTYDAATFQFNGLYTDKIHSRRLDFQSNPSVYGRRAILSNQDLILVNGNHFAAKEQIVFLHSKKIESLQRKTDRLTNVIAVIEIDTDLNACPFLNAFLHTHTRVFGSGEQHTLIPWLDKRITEAPVKGLVLAGGKSVRMGTDKSMIQYHGIPQREHLMQMLSSLLLPTYLSCRPGQADEIKTDFPLIPDRFTGLGPYGAILSAMMFAPDYAWLVVATDLPMVTMDTLRQLIEYRNPSKVATAFHNPSTGFPEPLITLWEPKAYPVLLSFLAQGNSCPRKALINSDVQILEPHDPQWLMNVNTPEEAEEAKAKARAG
ncbi:MAG TPA: NTP transferase domain-containing protein [Saprospiraceae bacterium]|nr:NTP transferase domain-containing protein [Saprospiraceae bacterium]